MPIGTNDSMQSFGSEMTLLARMGSVNTANILPQNVASNMQAVPQEWCERDMPCSVYGHSRRDFFFNHLVLHILIPSSETAYPEDWQDGDIRAFGTSKISSTRNLFQIDLT
jgi:hypothetical protein